MTPLLLCASLELTPLPPLHEGSVQDYVEFGQTRVDMPAELVDTLYTNRVEGQKLEACLDIANEEAIRAGIVANEAIAGQKEAQRKLLRKPGWAVAGVALVGGLVGGIVLGAQASSL